MDFQRLFKRKEDSSPAMNRENTRDAFNERDLLVCEGELLDGQLPASLNWSKVGGTIRLKAEKILGILEGRTRIKAAVLQELYPAVFEKAPNPGTEFTIPLQTVVRQLEDIFAGAAPEEADLDGFDTPFGQLAGEDEARFKEKPADAIRSPAAPKLFLLQQPESKPIVTEPDQIAGSEKMPLNAAVEKSLFDKDNRETGRPFGSGEIHRDLERHPSPAEQPKPTNEERVPAFEAREVSLGDSAPLSRAGRTQSHNFRKEGHEYLQELYLTDEPLDGSKVADLILRLPRIAGVVIMLSDGAVLGGGLSGGLSESLLSLTPDFVKHLLVFTGSMQGGPAKFVPFSGPPCHISLTIDGDVLILAGHE